MSVFAKPAPRGRPAPFRQKAGAPRTRKCDQNDSDPKNVSPEYTKCDARRVLASKANDLEIALIGRQAFGVPLVAQSSAAFINPSRTIAPEITKDF